jgi:hypothetical protein
MIDEEKILKELLSQSLMGKALLHILQDKEGVMVEHENNQFIIWRDNNTIQVYDGNEEPEFKDGQLIWMHTELDA